MPKSEAVPGALVTTDQPAGNAAVLGHLTVLPSRGGDGLGVSVKVDRSGRVFRIEPARDPRAPRFWCLRVYRCGTTQETAEMAPPWYGTGGMTRTDLPAAVAAIRADPTEWLAKAAGAALRDWMLDQEVSPA